MKKVIILGLLICLLLGIHVYSHREKPEDLAGDWKTVGYLFLGEYWPFSENQAMERRFGDVRVHISRDGSFSYRNNFLFHGNLKYQRKFREPYPRFLMEVATYDNSSAEDNVYTGNPFLLVKGTEDLVVITQYDPETDKIGDMPLVFERVS